MDPMPVERPPLVVASPRVRVQRFGSPSDAGKLLARLLASAAVAGGVIYLSFLANPSESFGGVVAVLGFFFIVVALLASVPLGGAMVWTWLFALFSRTRGGALYIGRSLCVERGQRLDTFAPADVVSVGAPRLAPGWMAIRLESGDVIRAEISDPADRAAIAEAIADGGGRGPWIAPLYAPPSPRSLARPLAIAVTLFAALVTFIVAELFSRSDALALLTGWAGLLAWLTVLRPGPARRHLAIGTDGVDLRGEGARRFLPFTRIERLEPTPYGADLVLVEGERVPLSVVAPEVTLLGNARKPSPTVRGGPESPALSLALRRREALLQRLQAGLGAGEALAGEERLASQGLSLSAWREAVRGLVNEGAPGYRAARLPTEQAVRILERGRAAPEARIGAALALAGSTDQALRQRLRIAIEDCADEPTQTALALALEDQLYPSTLARVQRVGERR